MATTKRKRATTRADNQASSDDLLKYYREMLLIRRFEEKAGQLYGMGLIGGFCHLYIGQEAVVVGMQAAVTGDDGVVTSYRDHGHMLACGMDAGGVMAAIQERGFAIVDVTTREADLEDVFLNLTRAKAA